MGTFDGIHLDPYGPFAHGFECGACCHDDTQTVGGPRYEEEEAQAAFDRGYNAGAQARDIAFNLEESRSAIWQCVGCGFESKDPREQMQHDCPPKAH